MTSISDTFEWGRISGKQVDVLTWWHPHSRLSVNDIIIADGAVRSGKTLSMSFSFIIWAFSRFDGRLFGMAGKTIGSFRKNVLRDLKRVLAGRGYRVKDNRSDNILEVSKGGTSNSFEIFGGKDAGSQDLIQGRTLAGVFLDEVTLMPKSFIDQAMARCSVDGSRIWMNCNPAGPFHFIKTDFIDTAEEKNVLNIHFELDDNLTLSEQIKNRLKTLYSGLFYKRYILGLWVMAEGIIYDMFDPDKHTVNTSKRKYKHYMAAIDYGTSNPFALGIFGYNSQDDIALLKEYYYNSADTGRQKTDGEYADDVERELAAFPVEKIFCDPSALSFITELHRRRLPAVKADNDVLEGIRYTSETIATGRFCIDRSCVNTIKEFETYSWDPKAQARGEDKPLKEHDHAMDMIRYFLYSQFGRMGPIAYSSNDDEAGDDTENNAGGRGRRSFGRGGIGGRWVR